MPCFGQTAVCLTLSPYTHAFLQKNLDHLILNRGFAYPPGAGQDLQATLFACNIAIVSPAICPHFTTNLYFSQEIFEVYFKCLNGRVVAANVDLFKLI